MLEGTYDRNDAQFLFKNRHRKKGKKKRKKKEERKEKTADDAEKNGKAVLKKELVRVLPLHQRLMKPNIDTILASQPSPY